MAEQMRSTFSFLGRAWCRTMHNRPMWPIHGEYECSTCLRRYRVPWDKADGEPNTQLLETRGERASETASEKVPRFA